MWFLGVVAAIILAVVLLRHYAERTTQLYILCLVAFSWSLGFTYFLVLPFDLEHAFCRACREHGSHAADCRCLPMPGIEILDDLFPIVYGRAPPAPPTRHASRRRA